MDGARIAAHAGQHLYHAQLKATGTVILLPMLVVGIANRLWLVRGLTMGAIVGQ